MRFGIFAMLHCRWLYLQGRLYATAIEMVYGIAGLL